MTKKVPVITVAERDEAARLAGLPVEATLSLTDVAGAIREGLLAFSAATGLLVMRQMMQTSSPPGSGRSTPSCPGGRGTGMAPPPVRW